MDFYLFSRDNFVGIKSLFVGAIGEIRQRFVLLGGACRLALVLPAFPSVQAVPAENFFRALDVVFDVVVQEICKQEESQTLRDLPAIAKYEFRNRLKSLIELTWTLNVTISTFLIFSAPLFAVDLHNTL